ncbi:SEC-C domain-containing protein [Spongiibacter sp. KMU-158]|uniref:SEC-C domain-containing protein n=1 Tax=Spongiibacter pelagi TaxID=2760804 RepID=A0A927GWM5_9GAMM|nr:YchJ family metal-binding protein [Spongiibacter pelagi]MBD2859906.1 SEC-C domain-containing protein [Spongiibacter pelagi]
MSEQLCACGSTRLFSDCCQPIVEGVRLAPSAEALMRSRYTAFSRNYPQYLLDSLHPERREAETLAALEASCQEGQWRSLRILKTQAGGPGDDYGEVEFLAFYGGGSSASAMPDQLHENSRFHRLDGAWYYRDGEILPPIKLGRNDACWCGSGIKLKKCSHDGVESA